MDNFSEDVFRSNGEVILIGNHSIYFNGQLDHRIIIRHYKSSELRFQIQFKYIHNIQDISRTLILLWFLQRPQRSSNLL